MSSDHIASRLNDATTLASYGTLCELLSDSDWAQVTDQTKLCEQKGAIAAAYERQATGREMRELYGFHSSECGQTGRGACLERLLEASKSAACQGTATARRKRATSCGFCEASHIVISTMVLAAFLRN